MLSYKNALLVNPQKFKPLGTVKGKNNVESRRKFNDVDIKDIFTSRSNIAMMSYSLFKVNKQNGGSQTKEQVYLDTIKLMKCFLTIVDVYQYETADYQATGNMNFVELLKTINNDFLKFSYSKYIKWNEFVPTRMNVEVGPRGSRKDRKMYELRPDEIITIDYWRNQETRVAGRNFRYNNEIPFWRTWLHNRHYDRSNEGLRENEPDRASLDTPVYNAYDMSGIHKVLDGWCKTSWFGMK